VLLVKDLAIHCETRLVAARFRSRRDISALFRGTLDHKKLSRLARSTQQHLNISQCSLQDFLTQHKRYHSLCALEITNESSDLFNSNIIDCDGIIIDHEAQGVRQALLDICTRAIHLPM